MNKLELVIDGVLQKDAESAAESCEHVICTSIEDGLKKCVGFHTENDVKKWAEENGTLTQYEASFQAELQARSAQPKTTHEEELIRLRQSAMIDQHEWLLRELFRLDGRDETDFENIQEYVGKGDIFTGFKFGTIIIYDKTNCKGDWRLLPSYTSSIPYPKFSWMKFNDKTESVYNLGIHYKLYQHTWFRGKTYSSWAPGKDSDIGWFKNRASSAIVW